jgi:CubicO group peptidase (beta-lactamase class C family)
LREVSEFMFKLTYLSQGSTIWQTNRRILSYHKLVSSHSRPYVTTSNSSPSDDNQLFAQTHEDKLKTINDVFQNYLRQGNNSLTGIAVAICGRNRTTTFLTNGIGDYENNNLVTPQTVFRFGNITASITAAAILQLYEKGKVNLEDNANVYLSKYQIVSKTSVTIKHLLTHTSGILPKKIGVLRRLGLGRSFEDITSPIKPQVDVGLFSYSFMNNLILADVIEAVSGVSFEAYIKENVITRLGMKTTGYSLNEDSSLRMNFAPAYFSARRGPPRRVPELYTKILPRRALGLLSSVADMSLFVEALLNEGANANGRLLQPNSVKLMLEPQFQRHPKLPGITYGFLWDHYETKIPIVHANVQLYGYEGVIFILPKHDYGFIVISNEAKPNSRFLVLPLIRVLTSTRFPPRVNYESVGHTLLAPKLVGRYMDPISKKGAVRIGMTKDGAMWISMKGLPGKSAIFRPADSHDPTLWVFNSLETMIIRRHWKAVDRLRHAPAEEREKLQAEIDEVDSRALASVSHSDVYLVADLSPKSGDSSNIRDAQVNAVIIGYNRYPRLVRSIWFWIFEGVLVVSVLAGCGFAIAHFLL